LIGVVIVVIIESLIGVVIVVIIESLIGVVIVVIIESLIGVVIDTWVISMTSCSFISSSIICHNLYFLLLFKL